MDDLTKLRDEGTWLCLKCGARTPFGIVHNCTDGSSTVLGTRRGLVYAPAPRMTDEEMLGLEPPGCPTPGACSCVSLEQQPEKENKP